jgi:glycerol-3-phosphate acyltransferase PlsY
MVAVTSVLVLAYLLGSFPTSIIAGKVLRGIDIREHGSGNAGGTNVFRVLGWKPGLVVTAVDVFKGFIAAAWLPLWIAPDMTHLPFLQLAAGIAAVFGHIWTIFAGFRGGKGVGTAAGMLLALFSEAVIYCILVFAVVLLLTRYVSLSSISAAVTFPVVLTVFRYLLDREVPLPFYIFSFFAAALIIYTHRANIKRLLNGNENRIGRPKKV